MRIVATKEEHILKKTITNVIDNEEINITRFKVDDKDNLLSIYFSVKVKDLAQLTIGLHKKRSACDYRDYS